jgi:cytochrome P450
LNIVTYRTDRACSKTTDVKGVTIPQGSVVIIPILLLHHDPQYWNDPEKFDPDRYKKL